MKFEVQRGWPHDPARLDIPFRAASRAVLLAYGAQPQGLEEKEEVFECLSEIVRAPWLTGSLREAARRVLSGEEPEGDDSVDVCYLLR